MAAGATEAQPRGSAEFVQSSVLEAVVPSDSSFDIEDEISSWDGTIEDESSSILPFISQRRALLFDERVAVYVVFRTPVVNENTLKVYLTRLAITLEGFAFSTAPPPDTEAKPSPPKELIYSETIQESNDPLLVRYDDDDDNPHVFVIWKVDVFISRPRGRFYQPAVYFQPTASLKPAEKAKRGVLDDEYLPSKVPTALNLLQAFESDPALAGTNPRLSALRISKIAPTATATRELVRPIRTGQRRLFRALPALIWRMKYSKSHQPLNNASLIASFELEVAHITGCRVKIENIHLSLKGGKVQAITDVQGSNVIHKPGDQFAYLYKLEPDLNLDGFPMLGSDGHTVNVTISAKALISSETEAKLAIEWKTAVDFLGDHNPNLVKAAHRMSNPVTQLHTKSTDPDSLLPQEPSAQGDDSQSKGINVTLTISGPPRVKVGEMFHWDVFIVNRSEKTRKLAIVTIPKRRRDYERHKSHPSTSSIGGHRSEKKDLLTSAVVDENIIYAKQKSARIEAAELICLTTDLRIGHLASGACFTAELKFLALSPGVLSVESVRVVDLATQEAGDVRDLPSIIAIEQGS